MRIWRITYKPNYKASLSKGKPNIRKILFDQETNEEYNEFISERMEEVCDDYNAVMDLLNEAAAQTASEPEKVEKRWFEFNKETLMPIMMNATNSCTDFEPKISTMKQERK